MESDINIDIAWLNCVSINRGIVKISKDNQWCEKISRPQV